MRTPWSPPTARLYLHGDPTRPLPGALAPVAGIVRRQAAAFARTIEVPFVEGNHNSLLIRARTAQSRLVTLAVQWRRTGERHLRDAAVAYADLIGTWKHWSWRAWREGLRGPNGDFDLSYGENSATLALALDLLGDALSASETARLRGYLRRWCIGPFLHHTTPGRQAWWLGKTNSNWNTVCAGGAGMAALMLGDQEAGVRTVRKRVEASIGRYMRHLDETDGGWPEGLGYWNYGKRYAFMYLLSHERMTGRPHPLLRRAATRKTLAFPLDCTPRGEIASFGDVAGWSPLPVHLGAAVALGEDAVRQRLEPRLAGRRWNPGSTWPDAAELLCLHPRDVPSQPRGGGPLRHLYTGLGWGLTADDALEPRLFAAVRGGTTKVPHAHQDLLDLAVIVDGETLLRCAAPPEYLDTTFSNRRWSLWELTPQAKNTVLINGVGVMPDAVAGIATLDVGRHGGFRLDATEAMGLINERPVATFCGRAVLRLGSRALLVVDRVELPFPGRVEQRWLTPASLNRTRSGGIIRGKRAHLHLAYAADVPCSILGGDAPQTSPMQRAAHLLRICSTNRTHCTFTCATLLSACGPATVSLAASAGRLVMVATGRDWRERVVLNERLLPGR